MDIARQYDARTCEVLRAQCIDERVLPRLHKTLRTFPQLKSGALLVAQFWNDEARDAVHGILVYSSAQRPDLSAWQARCDQFYGQPRDEDDPTTEGEELSLDWLVEGYDLAIEIGQEFGEEHSWVTWDANNQVIPLFAAFCKEGTDQLQPVHEAFVPYALFVRDDAGRLHIEIVGHMLRPWLDGVAAAWAMKQ